jgi:hypothetical protein
VRHHLSRIAVVTVLGATTIAGAVWAGVGPSPDDGPVAVSSGPTAAASGERLPAGLFHVGADVTSLAPSPPEGSTWKTEGCPELEQHQEVFVEHLATPLVSEGRTGWPVDPDCIYLGGYGIGPARAATGVDPHAGINVRTLAISNGVDTVIWQMVDMVGFFSHYRPEICDGCGIAQIRDAIATSTGIPVENLAIGSTHTHGGADGYGAWGGLPRWYREQIRDDVVASAEAALAAMQPATIEVGSIEARGFNAERRDLYHSVPDYGAVWLQARAVPAKKRQTGEVLATLVNYAAHPTVLGQSNTLLHGDWPATAAKALGDSLGGVGLVFEGGLGNVSPKGGGVVEMGEAFAAFLADDIARGGTGLQSNDVAGASATITHPITNWAETGLGVAGLLDRDFLPGDAAGGPGAYEWSKNDSSPRKCATAGPLTVKTEVSAFRVGELAVVTAPGEIFSNLSQVLKSELRAGANAGGQTMVFGQTQDSLGYIIQSFEVDPVGGAAEYVPGAELAEYEETFMLDRCVGDHVLDVALDLGRQLGG